MDREVFLARVRSAAGPRMDDAGAPEDWAPEIDDPIGRFREELEEVGGKVWVTASGGAAEVLGSIVKSIAPSKVLVTNEPQLPDGLRSSLDGLATEIVEWPSCGVEGAASADVSITGAEAGIAETGSILVSSAAPGGRLPSLLSQVNIAFLPASEIRPTLAALFGDLPDLRRHASTLVLCTGPSKSSDIGNELFVGVHGPGVTHVIVLEDA